jgi:hypothetical protein
MINAAEMGEKRRSTSLTTVFERHEKISWETPDGHRADIDSVI